MTITIPKILILLIIIIILIFYKKKKKQNIILESLEYACIIIFLVELLRQFLYILF